MIILNLIIKENGKIKEVRAFKSQFRLINFIKILLEENAEKEIEFHYNDITHLMCEDPEIFKETPYKGTRLFISELTD